MTEDEVFDIIPVDPATEAVHTDETAGAEPCFLVYLKANGRCTNHFE